MNKLTRYIRSHQILSYTGMFATTIGISHYLLYRGVHNDFAYIGVGAIVGILWPTGRK